MSANVRTTNFNKLLNLKKYSFVKDIYTVERIS